MTDRPWKAAERRAAKLIGGRRYPANTGRGVDCESESYCIEVKERQRASLTELSAWALEIERVSVQRTPPKIGLVLVKRRGGRGKATPTLVVMTVAAFTEMNGTKALGELLTPS
jgi:hypothetical protein